MAVLLEVKGLTRKWLTFSGDSSILDRVDMDELLLVPAVGELSELLAVVDGGGIASVVGTTRSLVEGA